MALTEEQKAMVTALREISRSMDVEQAQDIREAYHKTMEGLYALAELLVVADAMQEQTASPLLVEHVLAVEALDAMKQSLLGAVV